jgi:flavin reductase ActVB
MTTALMTTALMTTALMSTASDSPYTPTDQLSASPEEFCAAMAALAAPVTVVTCYDDTGAPRGLTASAVSSLSLDPPLFLVYIDRGSRTHAALSGAPSFCVNLMGPENEALARQFAGPSEHRFAGIRLARAAEGSSPPPAPGLADSALRLNCVRHDTVDGGDHTILVGRVTFVEGTSHRAGGLGKSAAAAPGDHDGESWRHRDGISQCIRRPPGPTGPTGRRDHKNGRRPGGGGAPDLRPDSGPRDPQSWPQSQSQSRVSGRRPQSQISSRSRPGRRTRSGPP